MSKIETFSMWTPFELLSKARDKSEKMVGRIGGVISTATVDHQGETLDQDGVDWNYFLKHGWFNYEHKAGPENVLGHPETVVKGDFGGKAATRVEGVLYLHKPKAAEIYETAQAMQKAEASRRLGFSVEGQVMARDKKKILKARVLNVAITAHPVNPDARLEVLAKSIPMAGVGYQTPAGTSGQSLSPLVPQSLENTLSNADYGSISPFITAEMRNGRKITVTKLVSVIKSVYPSISNDRATGLAAEIVRILAR